ncbi:hypothetical protein B0T11DRAFT_2248 [Plectosphaerella cucumerina]|uniref:NAD-dependent epimerase/dehydratase domain-containing protein n=1 Tax=Plectosphaerella cucumerina TaxID=40658 RepID=A0A8K0X7A4_9PEZI|nr:hypothetical protein B0T11DRAFT_2248 [Plectosphaerella cucumerina]
MSSNQTILITGLNGYIGARTAEAFLQAGYRVRGSVRSSRSAEETLKALDTYRDQIEIVEVPDITASGAFDAAVQGVHGIAHLAAPVSLSFTEAEPVIRTATTATWGILESAAKEPSVKSVVLMSSIAAVVDSTRQGPHVFTEVDWNLKSLELVKMLGDKSPGPLIYAASKTAAEKSFWDFKDEKKPGFAMTSVNPVFVNGPPLATPSSRDKIPETTAYIFDVLSGKPIQPAAGTFSWYVDVRDVARVVVFAVEKSEVAKDERYIVGDAWGPPQAVADILRKAYPGGKVQEGEAGAGYLEGFKTPADISIDASKAVKATGTPWISYEKSVLDTAKAYEGLLV